MGSYYPSQRVINMFVFLWVIFEMLRKKKSLLKLANENETFLIIICSIKHMYMETKLPYFNITENILCKSVGGKSELGR